MILIQKTRLTMLALVVVAASVTILPSQVNASTLSELQLQLQQLINQVAALKNQPTKTTPETPLVCTTSQATITFGSTGQAVSNLQSFLISKGHSIPAGVTGFWGEQTKQALMRFQSAQNLANTGVLDNATKSRIQSFCVITPSTTSTPKAPTPTETAPVTVSVDDLKGEGSIERFDVKDGNDTDLEENDKAVEVMEVSFKVVDGDVKVNRMDIALRPDLANDEQDPWDVFGVISVWNAGKKITELDGSLKRNWRENTPVSGTYTLRLTNLNHTVKANREATLTIKTDVQKSVKGVNDGEVWHFSVPTNGIRGLDADKTFVYAGNSSDTVTVNIDQGGSRDEIIIRRSNSDLTASSLRVKDTGVSGFTKVFSFDIDTDDSKNPIEIRKIPIRLSVSSSTMNTFVHDVRLKVDGKTYTNKTLSDGPVGTATFEFKRGELVISAGKKVTATVEVNFKKLAASNEGTTVTGSVVASTITARGAETLTGNQLSSSARGEAHALYAKGQSVTPKNMAAVVTSVSGAVNDYVTFTGTVTLTPFGQDVYIPINNSGVSYKLTDSLNNNLPSSGTAVITSSAREVGNYFVIREGSSETLTIEVTYVPGIPNTAARMQITSINFSDGPNPANQSWIAQPEASYRTPTKIILN